MATYAYEDCVFINCPFDDDYLPVFRAIIFAVHDCGFVSRSALEISNSAEVRIDKIVRIIGECKFGIHDISRTELNEFGLPRFNMPLELGIFLGCKAYGGKAHRSKNCIVFDRDAFRYQRFISDIAGQDIYCHDATPEGAIVKVRDWLNTVREEKPLPDGLAISRRYRQFNKALPKLCRMSDLNPRRLNFRDYQYAAVGWLKRNAREIE